MWILPVSRRDLVDLITPRGAGGVPNAVEENRPSFDIVRPDRMVAVWPDRPTAFARIPTAIIVPDGLQRDSLAWFVTYVREFRPFTAFFRVVEETIAEHFLRGPSTPHLQDLEGICAGLILGEALTHSRGSASILDLPTTAYSATLSHVISRTLALTDGSMPLDYIARLWMQVRELTSQNGLGVSPDAILSVWAVALGLHGRQAKSRSLFEPTDILSAAWSELTTAGEIRDHVWHRLVEGYPDLDPMRTLIKMPREQRVQMIDIALRMLATSRREVDERRAFLAGYFTSLLAPGSLDHADILMPVASLLPTAYLWFGLCAGVNSRGDALPVGNPLARRIVRDLTIADRLVDRPRCDVAIDEFIIQGIGDGLPRLTGKAGRLEIDILPGVTVAARWPPHVPANEDEMRRAKESEMQHLLAEMDETTIRWLQITERLREMISLRDSRQQGAKKRRGSK